MMVLAHAAAVAPLPLYVVRVDLGCNHELVASPDHGAFVDYVTTFSS
jgi:hypothetical protein